MLIIWDSKNIVPESQNLIYTWNGYNEEGNKKSLFKYIDENDKSLRSEYLAWVYDLGEFEIEGKKIKDHFLIEDDFSYWWMTLFVEKSPWTQPSIIDAIRIFAINKILKAQNFDKLLLVSNNNQLNKILKDLCNSIGIVYEWKKENSKDTKVKNNFFKKLPLFIQSLLAIAKYYIERKTLTRVEHINWFNNNSIFFCSYFFNLESSSVENGLFYSKQWESLPNAIKKMFPSQNWLNIYYPHDFVPNTKRASEIANIFNNAKYKNGFHTFIDSFLSIKIVCKVISKYFKLYLITLKVKKGIKQAFSPLNYNFSLWPIMEKDFYRSTIGPLAINNLFYIELFNKALSKLPKQKKGLFLYENLSWESAFLYFWKKHGHGKIFGIAHSTIRFWDFRYFYDIRLINTIDINKFPQADFIALNGEAAYKIFNEACYPKEKIVKCEALRYLHFHNPLYKKNSETKSEVLKILILGDYMVSGTNNMLSLVEKAIATFPSLQNIKFSIKPHPNFQPIVNDFPLLKLDIVNNQLYKILNNYDVTISSNMTSASVDACLAGLPVIIFLEETELNFSPLRSNKNAFFVSSSEEVFQAILNISNKKNTIDDELKNFFFLDPELTKWQKILES